MTSLAQPLTRLRPFHGGLQLDDHKSESTRDPIARAQLPAQLILPLQQHIGASAKPLVKPGEAVLKGQPIAQADGYVSAYLHAPTSGTVTAVERRPVAHPSGLSAPCVVITPDRQEAWGELPPPLTNFLAIDPAQLRRRVRESGIVGLGGAAFPSAVKLNPGPISRIDLLILNGAECEPYITCDDMLMREHPRRVVDGLLIMRYILQVKEVIIGIEDNKREALRALESALAEIGPQAQHIRLQQVPTVYPAGGEKQLIKVLTGKEVPSNGIPAEIGIVCHNVGTAVAVFDAVVEGRPLISRNVTVTGDGIRRPRVLEALFGTPVAELVRQCGGYTAAARRLILGGPMMGFALSDDEVPITKGANCILATSAIPFTSTEPALPCIRCGACTEVCPANLLPQQLYWHTRAKELDKAQDYHLFDCIECGCCAAVCPSRIPLVQYYRFAKTEIWAQERDKAKSDIARQRHEMRVARLEREKQERAAKLRRKKTALDRSAQSDDPQESKKAAIAAARARAKTKRAKQTASSQSTLVRPSQASVESPLTPAESQD
jgi:electron transport complex protein RnfC